MHKDSRSENETKSRLIIDTSATHLYTNDSGVKPTLVAAIRFYLSKWLLLMKSTVSVYLIIGWLKIFCICLNLAINLDRFLLRVEGGF